MRSAVTTHLRSHTPVMQTLAASTDALQSATVEMLALTASLTQVVLKLSDNQCPELESGQRP